MKGFRVAIQETFSQPSLQLQDQFISTFLSTFINKILTHFCCRRATTITKQIISLFSLTIIVQDYLWMQSVIFIYFYIIDMFFHLSSIETHTHQIIRKCLQPTHTKILLYDKQNNNNKKVLAWLNQNPIQLWRHTRVM